MNPENVSENQKGETVDSNFHPDKTKEGAEIKDKLEEEYQRRAAIIGAITETLGIDKNLVIIAPPVLDRTDLGYTSDIDLIFLGTEEEGDKLYQEAYDRFHIQPFIIHIGSEKLVHLQKELPEMYNFLIERRGNIPISKAKEEYLPDENFLNNIGDLENKARTILTQEEKRLLKERRLAIGHEFVEEVKQKIHILGYSFSGSTTGDLEKFGVNSDIDIEFLIDEKSEKNVFDWIHVYLKWKYAELYGIKIDPLEEDINSLRKMASHDPKLIEYYKKVYGADISAIE